MQLSNKERKERKKENDENERERRVGDEKRVNEYNSKRKLGPNSERRLEPLRRVLNSTKILGWATKNRWVTKNE